MSKNKRISTAERIRLYGPACKPPLVNVADDLPWRTRTTDGRTGGVSIHKAIAEELVLACADARDRSNWLPMRMGTYNCRQIRGSRSMSVHSWGMAFDIFATPIDVYPPGGVWTPDGHFRYPRGHAEEEVVLPSFLEFAAAFEDRGWTWGGRFKRRSTPSGQTRARTSQPGFDVPHFEWSATPPDLPGRRFRDLRPGSMGKAVADLQQFLRELWEADSGNAPNPGPVDGRFGPKTERAVVAYRARLKLSADPVWDAAARIASSLVMNTIKELEKDTERRQARKVRRARVQARKERRAEREERRARAAAAESARLAQVLTAQQAAFKKQAEEKERARVEAKRQERVAAEQKARLERAEEIARKEALKDLPPPPVPTLEQRIAALEKLFRDFVARFTK